MLRASITEKRNCLKNKDYCTYFSRHWYVNKVYKAFVNIEQYLDNKKKSFLYHTWVRNTSNNIEWKKNIKYSEIKFSKVSLVTDSDRCTMPVKHYWKPTFRHLIRKYFINLFNCNNMSTGVLEIIFSYISWVKWQQLKRCSWDGVWLRNEFYFWLHCFM